VETVAVERPSDPHSLKKFLQVAAAAAQNVCQVVTNFTQITWAELHKTQGLAAVASFLKEHQLRQTLAVVAAVALLMETVREELVAMVALELYSSFILKNH
jgi:hypothetical protein